MTKTKALKIIEAYREYYLMIDDSEWRDAWGLERAYAIMWLESNPPISIKDQRKYGINYFYGW